MKWMLAVGMAPGHFWINLNVKNAASWWIICHKRSKGDACFARTSKICYWQDVSISMNDHWWFHYMETNGPVLCNGTRCFAHRWFVMILARATYADLRGAIDGWRELATCDEVHYSYGFLDWMRSGKRDQWTEWFCVSFCGMGLVYGGDEAQKVSTDFCSQREYHSHWNSDEKCEVHHGHYRSTVGHQTFELERCFVWWRWSFERRKYTGATWITWITDIIS